MAHGDPVYKHDVMILYCDPSFERTVKLRYGDHERLLTNPQSETLLQTMVELVDDQWTGVALINQAASFTLIRLLVAICNALAYSKSIKLYSITSLDEPLPQPVPLLVPHYQKLPNITV